MLYLTRDVHTTARNIEKHSDIRFSAVVEALITAKTPIQIQTESILGRLWELPSSAQSSLVTAVKTTLCFDTLGNSNSLSCSVIYKMQTVFYSFSLRLCLLGSASFCCFRVSESKSARVPA